MFSMLVPWGRRSQRNAITAFTRSSWGTSMSSTTSVDHHQQAKSERTVESKNVQVVAVDDDPIALRVLSKHLQDAGYQTIAIDNGETALEVISDETAVVLLDLQLPGVSGMDCLRFLRKHHPDVRVVILTGSGDVHDAVAAMQGGAFEYVTKPYDPAELLVHVNKAVEARNLLRENESLRESLTSNVPASLSPVQCPTDNQLTENIHRIASLDSTVMIRGESGTGKSTVARMIHQNGPRKDKPFVAINCASLPRDLIESELFGHSRGAFTGAVKDRPGRAEVADAGTLFLDEIGDLPLELQPKLLTFLQDRTIQRIGSNDTKKVDVRLIVATHRNLAEMCTTNHFRQDLYYRLNVLRMDIPPLRDRKEEIPMLVANILKRIADRQNATCPLVSDEALLTLAGYHWPGNIRELENVLERAAAFCKTDRIGHSDLMFDNMIAMHEKAGRTHSAVVGKLPTPGVPTLAGMTLEQIERQAIIETLAACGGNKAKTARTLGISEKSVYNKMRRLGITLKSAGLAD